MKLLPRTLYARLAAALTVLLVFIGAAYMAISQSVVRHHLAAAEQALGRDLARDLVADRDLVRSGRLDRAALERMFSDYMTINPSIEIYLLDLQGRILAFSADPGKVKRRRVDLAPVRAFLAGREGFPLLGDDPRSHDRRKIFSVTPVPSAEAPEGYLYVVLRGERYDSAARLFEDSALMRLGAAALGASLALGLVAGLVVFHRLTRRLDRLSGRMERFRASGFAVHEPYAPPDAATGADPGDEIDRLGASFDDMARRIVAQIEALRAQDANRRDLVAQVSHDLRTPLAALHGYLQTLELKWRDLGESERGEYLGIALAQAGRLRRLVDELFELARLEAPEVRLRREPVAVGELAADVAQKLTAPGRAPGAPAVQAEIDPRVPPVDADIALLERVLENLIDNALRHTAPGTDVVLTVGTVADGVRIAVRDHGPGIPPAELPRIFDRYYRVGPEARGHAGLGLAIARRIADLHGGRLTAANHPEGGLETELVLPVGARPATAGRPVRARAAREAAGGGGR